MVAQQVGGKVVDVLTWRKPVVRMLRPYLQR
ncbi:Uncharacterised protein [Escherichia coli]|nr:Uncharacterised protein [Escherichia coli]